MTTDPYKFGRQGLLFFFTLLFCTHTKSQIKWMEKDSGNYNNLSVIRYQEKNAVKNGPFEIFTNGVLVQKGFYKNGYKDSSWTYYCNGKIAAKKYYTLGKPSGKWTFYDSSGFASSLFDFDTNHFFVADRKNAKKKYAQIILTDTHENHPLFSDFEVTCFLENNLQYPKKALSKEEHGWVDIQLHIDKDGGVKEYRISTSVSPSLDQEALQKVKLFPFHFLPAYKDGKPVESWYVLKVKFPQIFLQ